MFQLYWSDEFSFIKLGCATSLSQKAETHHSGITAGLQYILTHVCFLRQKRSAGSCLYFTVLHHMSFHTLYASLVQIWA